MKHFPIHQPIFWESYRTASISTLDTNDCTSLSHNTTNSNTLMTLPHLDDSVTVIRTLFHSSQMQLYMDSATKVMSLNSATIHGKTVQQMNCSFKYLKYFHNQDCHQDCQDSYCQNCILLYVCMFWWLTVKKTIPSLGLQIGIYISYFILLRVSQNEINMHLYSLVTYPIQGHKTLEPKIYLDLSPVYHWTGID